MSTATRGVYVVAGVALSASAGTVGFAKSHASGGSISAPSDGLPSNPERSLNRTDGPTNASPTASITTPASQAPAASAGAVASALARAGRLIVTASFIALDYQACKVAARWGPASATTSSSSAAAVRAAAARERLRAAQDAHTGDGTASATPSLTPHATGLSAQARRTRAEVVAAAEEVAEAQRRLRAELGGEEQEPPVLSFEAAHRRGAARLLDLCRANGGCYVKVGQHLANLDYVLPRPYTAALAGLLDAAPVSAWEDVRAVLLEDLGAPPEDLFHHFDPHPFASASLAQVHAASDASGRQLAVKVQHRGLRETSRGDVAALCAAVRVADWLFEEFDFTWLAEEIAPHLPLELDFVHEAANSRRAARDLHAARLHRLCVVPEVLHHRSSARVLTMAFESGCRSTDVEELRRQGLPLERVSRAVSHVFNSQCFASGFVHCDPHAANVLVRPHPERPGWPQLVLVDHGLYRELDAGFRLEYAQLWRALVLSDIAQVQASAEALGVGGAMYPLLGAMLTARPWDEVLQPGMDSLHRPPSDADQAMIAGYVERYVPEILGIMSAIPRQMLLLLKMNDCLRHLDRALGAPENTFLVAAEWTSYALWRDACRAPTWRIVPECWKYVKTLFRIRCAALYARFVRMARSRRTAGAPQKAGM